MMAGSSQGGVWAIKVYLNTTLLMSVITDQTVTKSPKCCLQQRAELRILGQPPCVSSGLCAGRSMFRGAGVRRHRSLGQPSDRAIPASVLLWRKTCE